MNISHQKQVVLLAVLLGVNLSFSAMAITERAIICQVNGSVDYFALDATKQIYASKNFTYYQLIDGLTVLIVNNKTLKFNRLTNLNLLAHSTLDPNNPPEPRQFFSGSCQQPQPVKSQFNY